MTNQPDIVQPRIRRTGKSGNTAAVLAEQSTRVLIRVPKLSASATYSPATQSPLAQLQSIRPHSNPPPAIQSPGIQAKPLSSTLATAPAAAQPAHYSTTTEQLQGSPPALRPAANLSPATALRQAARIDAAHTAATGPHLAAPDWLNDHSRKSNAVAQTRLLLVVGAVAGFALGALTWHTRSNHLPATQNSASRNQAPSQGAPDKSRSAVNVTDSAAAEFNLPAQVSQTDVGPAISKDTKESTVSTWQWNPKGAANSPATIGQSNGVTETESAEMVTDSSTGESQVTDPSRAAWLQGTIDNVHANPTPVQR